MKVNVAGTQNYSSVGVIFIFFSIGVFITIIINWLNYKMRHNLYFGTLSLHSPAHSTLRSITTPLAWVQIAAGHFGLVSVAFLKF